MSNDAEQAQPARRRRNKRRNVLLVVLGLFLVAALASVVFVGNLARSFDTKTQKIPMAFPNETLRPVKPSEGPAADAMNVLILGSDSRGDSLDLAEGGDPSNQRSDTMMWMHIPADRKNIFLMSVMRDTWADIPGHGQAKINAAMAFGGVPLVVQTLEGMFKNRIDHVAIVDFEGFKAITDALGGVEVDVPLPFTSTHGDYTFAAGPQKLNGDQALAFVRERYAFSDGDFQRVKDQQIFLKAVLNTVLAPATLANPVTVTALVDKVSPYISVDSGLDAAVVGNLAVSLKSVRGGDVISFTLPSLGTGTSTDGQSIVLRDDDAIAAIAQALTDDSLGSYVKGAGLG
ncbi:LCP family protein [Specibacter sp. AOP5-B1-6]|uniref:LCP family protein n=1 Tax=Specibacter sp. AOP5-B1-6 TaxID=3457653 RepID=UPI00402B5D6D